MALQVEVLERSFKAVAPKGDEFVASFYDRPFAAHPEVKPLFSSVDIALQQKKLLGALVLAVENLRRPDVLVPVLKNLGKRHGGYGVKPEHYGAVGAALLDTFAAWRSETARSGAVAWMLINLKAAGHFLGRRTDTISGRSGRVCHRRWRVRPETRER